MANLTSNRLVESYKNSTIVKKSHAAAAKDPYYVGELVMYGGDDNRVKPVSKSDVPGTKIAGIVTEQQTVSNDGDTLHFDSGYFLFEDNGLGVSDINNVAWFEDDTKVYSAQGTNRITGGRIREFVSGSSIGNTVVVEVGNEVSQSV